MTEWKVTEETKAIFPYWPAHLSSRQKEGIKAVRKALREIAAGRPGVHFKTDPKSSCVWIRRIRSENGRQWTIASAKVSLDILDDAIRIPGDKFRDRLERFLKENGFEI